MLAWETISSLQSLPLPFSELFRAFETAQNTAFLVILSHWAPPLSVSFLWAPQQPSDQLEFLRNVCAWPYTAACSSAFLLWLPKSNLYRLLTLVLWIFFFLVISVSIHHLYCFFLFFIVYFCKWDFSPYNFWLYSFLREVFSYVFPDDPAPSGLRKVNQTSFALIAIVVGLVISSWPDGPGVLSCSLLRRTHPTPTLLEPLDTGYKAYDLSLQLFFGLEMPFVKCLCSIWIRSPAMRPNSIIVLNFNLVLPAQVGSGGVCVRPHACTCVHYACSRVGFSIA